MIDEAVRKEFEAWFNSETCPVHWSDSVETSAWEAWQAARSAAIQECADFVWKFYKIRTLSDEILALKER